jgi:hypothetical protein
MPPSKASRAAAHEDTDSKQTNSKEKNGHNTHQTNGKMRRVVSSTGSNLKEVQNAANMPSPTTEAPTSAPASNPSVRLSAHVSRFPCAVCDTTGLLTLSLITDPMDRL